MVFVKVLVDIEEHIDTFLSKKEIIGYSYCSHEKVNEIWNWKHSNIWKISGIPEVRCDEVEKVIQENVTSPFTCGYIFHLDFLQLECDENLFYDELYLRDGDKFTQVDSAVICRATERGLIFDLTDDRSY